MANTQNPKSKYFQGAHLNLSLCFNISHTTYKQSEIIRRMKGFAHNYNINSQIICGCCDSKLLFFLQALVHILMPQIPPFIGIKSEVDVQNQPRNSNLIGEAPFFKAASLLDKCSMSHSKFNISSSFFVKS